MSAKKEIIKKDAKTVVNLRKRPVRQRKSIRRFDRCSVVGRGSTKGSAMRRHYRFAHLWRVGRSCGRVSSGGSRRLRRSGRGYTPRQNAARREPEPSPHFPLRASPIDRNRRVQLVERRFGTVSSPGVIYEEDLLEGVFMNGFTRALPGARGVKDEAIIARLSIALATILMLRSRKPRIAAARAAEKRGRFRSGARSRLISV